jgi:SAM-dependent methyltransferase
VSSQADIYRHRWEPAELQTVASVWRVLVKDFFQEFFGNESRVLDIGCGFCHFLNNLTAKEKVGVDANPLAREYASKDVQVYNTDDLSLKMLPDNYFDRVFISNFLEHLDNSKEILSLLNRVRQLLMPGGRVIILQPNFRLTGAAYFDFIDHKTILTERSLEEALKITGLQLEKEIVRFLPYTTKSNIPQSPFLVRLYLRFRPAWLIMGKQSLFIASKPMGVDGPCIA